LETFAILTFIASIVMIVAYVVYRRQTEWNWAGFGGPDAGSHAPDVPTVMIVLISLALLGASLWIILSNRYDADAEKWAFASSGSIVSFWLGTAVPK
jgi:hypothetical protein